MTTSSNGCPHTKVVVDPSKVAVCKPGKYYSKPAQGKESTIRDDYECLHCPAGKYSDPSQGTSATSCKDKSFPVGSTKKCPMGMSIYRGNDPTDNDWFCRPSTRFTALC